MVYALARRQQKNKKKNVIHTCLRKTYIYIVQKKHCRTPVIDERRPFWQIGSRGSESEGFYRSPTANCVRWEKRTTRRRSHSFIRTSLRRQIAIAMCCRRACCLYERCPLRSTLNTRVIHFSSNTPVVTSDKTCMKIRQNKKKRDKKYQRSHMIMFEITLLIQISIRLCVHFFPSSSLM